MLSIEILFGVSDIGQESWVNDFFPQDMPVEWRFDYYANEFDTLLISRDQPLDEIDADLKLCCEVESADPATQLKGVFAYVMFNNSGAYVLPSKISISPAKIVMQQNCEKTVCVLRVSSSFKVSNNDIKALLVHIRSEFQSFDRVFLYFSTAMQNMDTINTAKIINDLL